MRRLALEREQGMVGIGRLGGVDAERVLRGEAAVRPHEPGGADAVAQFAHHCGDRVHDVVVPGSAGERQAAGAGELLVERQAEALRAELHRRGEAGVQVDDVDVGLNELEVAPRLRASERMK